MSSSKELFNFKELTTDIQFVDVDGTIIGVPAVGVPNIGASATFSANLYAPGTDLSDDRPDELLGTKAEELKAIAQLGNGDLISEVTETIQLPTGNISIKGLLNNRELQFGETQTIPIVGGTGNFNNERGVQKITQPDPFVFDILDLSLQELEKIEGTRNSDVIEGKKHSEFITGNNGDDIIKGRQGDDIIEGDRGSDIIRGGAGDDTLAADRIDRAKDFNSLGSILQGDNGDDIIYGGSNDDLIGGGNDDDLLFGNSGDDLIRGGNGFDLIQGGVGNDILKGQGDIDVADYSDLTFNGVSGAVAGVDVNLDENQALHSSNNNALTWTDILTTIENVIGTSRNDRFIGDSNDNVFYGLEEVNRDEGQTEFMELGGESYKVAGDVVEYDGHQSDFTFGESQQPYVGGLTVTGDGIGTDILLGVEFIKFNDGLVAINSISH